MAGVARGPVADDVPAGRGSKHPETLRTVRRPLLKWLSQLEHDRKVVRMVRGHGYRPLPGVAGDVRIRLLACTKYFL